MDESTMNWVKRSFRLWLVCKVVAIVFWILAIGVPLSILLVMIIGTFLK